MSVAVEGQTSHTSARPSYTLDDFVSFARKECPAAFEIIADPKIYNFKNAVIHNKDSTSTARDALHVGYRDNDCYNITIWASIQDDNIRWHSSKGGPSVKSVDAAFPLQFESRISEYIVPFRFLAFNEWPTRGRLEAFSDPLSRRRLCFLVRFAFLLTGRLNKICSLKGLDLLGQFKEMCETMQAHKLIREGEAVSRSEDKSDNRVGETIELDVAEANNRCTESVTANTASVPVRSVKRAATPSLCDDGYVDSDIERDTNTRKRRKSTRQQTGNFPSASDSNEAAEPSKKMKELLAAVTEQYKTELRGAWAQGEYTSGQKIKMLQRQLVEKEKELSDKEKKLSDKDKESEEWKAKLLKLDARVKTFISGD